MKLIVVDNGSPNESQKILKEASKSEGFVMLFSENNVGYAAGNNIGIRFAINKGADYILVSNNDIEVESPIVLQEMINLIDSNPSIGVVSPRIIGKDGRNDPPLYFKKPSFWDLSFGTVSFRRNRFRFNDQVNQQIYAPRGSFMLFRANVIHEIGLLDEKTFLYFEEPILAEMLNNFGYQVWHCGLSTVVHNHGETISSTFTKKDICNFLVNSLKYYLKHYRKMNTIKIAICVLFKKIVFLRRK